MNSLLKKYHLLLTCLLLIGSFMLTSCDLFQDNSKTIALKDITIIDDIASIVYEDGYVLSIENIRQKALTYEDYGTTQNESDNTEDLHPSLQEALGSHESGVRILGTRSNPNNITVGGDPSIVVSNGSAIGSIMTIEMNGKTYEYYDDKLFAYFKDHLNEVTVSELMGEKTVSVILNGAFGNLSALETVTIPTTVTKIQKYAFYGCTSLTAIRFQGTMEQWNAIEKGTDWDKETGNYTVYCTNGEILKPAQ